MRMQTPLACLSLLLPSLFAAGAAHATTYEVGPGKSYANIGDVPIESLKAGDLVLINARSTPYREKFGLTSQGTAAAPITIRGVRDANGARPQIIGENATTRLALNYPSDTRGVINVYGASYLVIEGLDISRARGAFKDDNGASATFQKNASTIYLQSGSHITVRDCIMRDSGNGFFSTSGSSDVLVEGNYIYGNGNVGSVYEHNNYTESNGIVFQYNRFGPLCSGCSGNNLKDRSAGTVVRYNWIEGGNRALDLVDSGSFSGLASYRTTMVYGNVLIEQNDSGNSQVAHYGGDSGETASYRKGTLHFVHNTVVSYRTGRTKLIRLSTNDEKAEIRNNIVYATAGGSQLSLSDGLGTYVLSGNWISSGWTSGLAGGTLSQPGPQITGTNPGFVNFAAFDYHLLASSPARNAAGPLEAGAPTISRQYVPHLRSETRTTEGTPDIGAFEYRSTALAAQAALLHAANSDETNTPEASLRPTQDPPTSHETAAPGSDGELRENEAKSAEASGGCSTCPGARSRGLFGVGLVLAALVLVRGRRRFSRRKAAGVLISLILPALLAVGAAHATTYEVGPGKTYANIGDVPIESLKAGDLVLINARSTPYREKFGLTSQGTAAAPITIRGVRDASGARPQIVGTNATTRLALDYPSDARGIINISDASYLVIEGLDISGARGSFKDDNGSSATFQDNASTIYLQSGSHITVRDCLMHDAGNGFFSTSDSSDVLVEGNYIYDNGNEGSIYEHNNYTESDGIVFQYNRFGPLCDGCTGNNLKDRSAGCVIRYNWIEGGNRTLDLVESETFTDLASYRTTMVYGNVLIELDDSGNPQVVHYGGDSGDESTYRKGTLHFVHNTVVTFRSGRTRLFGLSSNDEKAEVRNNIIYATAGGAQLTISDGPGTFVMSGNWISSGWGTGIADGDLTQATPQITGTDPGFADFAAADYHLTASSPARNAAGALEAGAPTLDRQYVPHQGSEARVTEGKPDIGAFEYRGGNASPDAAIPPPPADAGAPDAPLPAPDTARADVAVRLDGRTADLALNRDTGFLIRDASITDMPLAVDTAQPLRDASLLDRPIAVDTLVFVKDSGAWDMGAQDRPSALDALVLAKDGGLRDSALRTDAAGSASSSDGCTTSPGAPPRRISTAWLVLGALILVRRRRDRS